MIHFFRVPNAKAGRDKVDINVYGMEGVPAEVIEERLNMKMTKKRQKLEKELLKLGIKNIQITKLYDNNLNVI